MSDFAKRLKAARVHSGLTQKDVQDRIGLGFRSLSRYERGTADPDPETVAKLIKLYDVSSDYIMGLSPDMGHATDANYGTSRSAPILSKEISQVIDHLGISENSVLICRGCEMKKLSFTPEQLATIEKMLNAIEPEDNDNL